MSLVQGFQSDNSRRNVPVYFCLLLGPWKKHLSYKKPNLSAFLPLGMVCTLEFQGHFLSLLLALPLEVF